MKIFSLGILVFAGVLAAGCSPETVEGVAKDTSRNTEIAVREGRKIERAARPAVNAIGKAAKPAFNKFQQGARVRAALLASSQLPKTIRADVSETRLRLAGTVKTEEQKALAEKITRNTLSKDAKIVNDIRVSP